MSDRDDRALDPAMHDRLRATMKKELRRSIGALRRAVPASARAVRDQAICERTVTLDAFTEAEVVAAYSAVRGEVDPRPLVERCWALGKTVVLPRVNRAAGTLGWYEHRADRPLVEGAFGIGEPALDAPEIGADRIDLVLVPAIAYDERGHRLGQGMGFYDRALPQLTRATRIGLAFDFQLVAELPDDPHDQPVDYVVSDRHLLDVRRTRAR